ncbi:hypothetical protein [Reichenbachiella sp. MALMAid0571]|uniref:hypothetical protein n=1 Tax=Reichenbachiella sp. MALMAid0571 TaxID=3143939 RepID=UPI0032DE6768
MLEEQTKNILSMLDYGSSIDHKWLWKLGEPMEDGIEAEKGGVDLQQKTGQKVKRILNN